MGEYEFVWGGQTNTDRNTNTDTQTHQHHDLAWPQGRAK